MKPLYLSEADVQPLLTMQQAIEQVERAYKARGLGQAFDVPRFRTRMPGAHLHILQGASLELGLLGFKAYYIQPHHRLSHIQLIERDSGRLLAIIDSSWIGQLRTGAATGVAVKHLARPDASRVGMFGSGWQAETQLEAVCQVRDVRDITVYSRNPERLKQFCDTMSRRLDRLVRPASSPQETIAGADILITITRGAGPVFESRWLEDGQFIAAAGVNAIDRRELDTETIGRADLVVADSLETARLESGDLQPAIEAGLLHWENVAEFGDIVAGNRRGRTSASQIVLFESHGMALQDLYCAAAIFAAARERGIGIELPMSN